MQTSRKLGLVALTALVFGLMVGVGIYNLPQNMASVASPLAVLLAWIITAAGIIPLVIAFNWLSNHYPQYNAGIYQYAQAEFGNYIGFNIAWGYWLCTAFSNVAYGVMLNDAIGAFVPVLLEHSWPSVLFITVFIWLMYLIVMNGIKTAKFVNTILAGIKVIMLVCIVIVFISFFNPALFEQNLNAVPLDLGGIGTQTTKTMMITLFCFFGVEGAVMMSARAKNIRDVGKAGFIGFVIAIFFYLAVSLLCFGLLTRSEISGLYNPSIAYILKDTCGVWAYWFVIIAVIISLLGGWVAWTLVVAQVPYEAAQVHILPRQFLKLNRNKMPSYSLRASSVAMTLFLLIVVMADDVYLAALQITGLMIIPSYLFTGLFLLKKADTARIRAVAILTTIFCLWMTYAGGIQEMLMTAMFYFIGTPFYIKAQKQYNPAAPIFTKKEKICCYILAILSIYSIYYFVTYLS